jgi:hypothetical protein
MRLATIAAMPMPTAAAATASDEPTPFEQATWNLDWAHETAGSATSEPEGMDTETLLGAADQAMTAAKLLDQLKLSDAASHARDAATAFDSAADAKLHEEPEVANGVVQARGEDAEAAIHDAFTAMGLDGRGE